MSPIEPAEESKPDPPAFVHEVPLRRTWGAHGVLAAILAAASASLWFLTAPGLNHGDLTVRLFTVGGAGVVQLLIFAGAFLAFGGPRSGVSRVLLTADEFRMQCPAGVFGWHLWTGRPFALPLARIARLVVNRYPLGGGDMSYTVVGDDGVEHDLSLPCANDTDDRQVWARLFDAIRRLRPDVPTDDWTHTLRGKAPTVG